MTCVGRYLPVTLRRGFELPMGLATTYSTHSGDHTTHHSRGFYHPHIRTVGGNNICKRIFRYFVKTSDNDRYWAFDRRVVLVEKAKYGYSGC